MLHANAFMMANTGSAYISRFLTTHRVTGDTDTDLTGTLHNHLMLSVFGATDMDGEDLDNALVIAIDNDSGNLTDGHPDNTLKVVVFYKIIDL